MRYGKSDHEEPETRTILHTLDGAADGATDLSNQSLYWTMMSHDQYLFFSLKGAPSKSSVN